jgi:hypothetical protein
MKVVICDGESVFLSVNKATERVYNCYAVALDFTRQGLMNVEQHGPTKQVAADLPVSAGQFAQALQ